MSIKSTQDSDCRSRLLGATTLVGALLSLVFASILGLYLAVCPTAEAGNAAVWNLVWSDEFEGPKGSPVDSSKWSHDVGGNGWGNNELETYTSRIANSDLEGGTLVIKALKETFTARMA